MGTRKKQNVSYTKPEEPAFLKRIKEKVGYKEGPTIDAKRPRVEHDAEGESDSDEERIIESKEEDQPQIVQLKEGDLTNEDVQKIVKQQQDIADMRKIEEGKIEFKKPAKMIAEEVSAGKSSSNSARSVAALKEDSKLADNDKLNSLQSRLLSFGDDEQDEDD